MHFRDRTVSPLSLPVSRPQCHVVQEAPFRNQEWATVWCWPQGGRPSRQRLELEGYRGVASIQSASPTCRALSPAGLPLSSSHSCSYCKGCAQKVEDPKSWPQCLHRLLDIPMPVASSLRTSDAEAGKGWHWGCFSNSEMDKACLPGGQQ